ncbi:tectonin beta-propeller repeat-containing protein 1 isoform X3 [Rhinatrema bivittatum]|uniref:tectonin beta-propeller repeat-containing protein 1 isoform X3 n=1 Tax=Rhinatrema bivittatum TaxID=194408 RepID=UPI00112CAB14|nr:tectonin beta-propeller repeat-containing protein 1 isoform X3 [Rhinatrema bivittatum]
MSHSLLWAVDVLGRVYTLSTAGPHWELCRDPQLEFKRVAAVKQCCWGLACDHHIYLYVHASDLPIRYQEETYENQRWNPVDGFCDRLLPSDRWQWSDVSGLKQQQLDSFQLPSSCWEWESDWYVDENIGGQPTEKGGWTYAVDFPATYLKDKKWNSCVRRRRWIRYRRYRARDTWAEIASREDGKQSLDPFNDIAVGGWEITDEPVGHLSVWAVSLQGKVWYREEVCHDNPEGVSWSELATPGEAVQISCGPNDLLWATLWEGQAVVREGIHRNNPKGSSWTIVEPPTPENGIMHVSVGTNVSWAVTKDRKVWFRRGVNSHNPCGTSWIEMVGEMMMINVGLNDQVWGIGCGDRAVYFRQGVTPSELSGKTWKAIAVSRENDRSHTGSSCSLLSAGCFFGDEVMEQQDSSILTDTDSLPDAGRPHTPQRAQSARPPEDDGLCNSESAMGSQIAASGPGWSQNSFPEGTDPAPDRDGEASAERSGGSRGPGSASAVLQWTSVDLAEARPGAAASSHPFDETSSLSSLGMYSAGADEPCGADGGPLWVWVAGGGCHVEPYSPLKWFTVNSGLVSSVQALSLSITPAQTAAWRKQIFQQLCERSRRELESFKHYEQAVEQSVWVKTGTLQWWRHWKPCKWVDVRVTLEQFTGSDGTRDSILFIYYTYYEEKKYIHVFLNEVTVLVEILNDEKHSFAIYTPEKTKQRWPIRLASGTEQEMHDWLALLSASCCESRRIQGPPSHQAIWSVTCKGDVFVSEPVSDLEAAANPTPCDQLFWRQIGGHLRVVECSSQGVVWGIGYDHTAWIYTGGYGGGFIQGLASSVDNIYSQTDVKCVYIYENQRWNPVTGYSSRGLPTDRYMWSDASGLQECTKANTKPPSPQWSWVSDWCIDFNAPGGADREGWQYAADFPASYHGHKTMKDFVRRRRWARKCKIVTSGPWLEVPPISLRDVSLTPSAAENCDSSLALWAISSKGDVLCRLDVTKQTPAGSSWLHVGTDQPFISVSVGADLQVWAIARDGSAFYRGSVSPQQPAGDCWYHVPSPQKQKLKQISVGQTSVFAVDENGNLWFRQGITPSYPQGSSWEHVSNNIRKVSVGPLDQVWVIADKVQGSLSLSCGTVCHRTGVQAQEPRGRSWDYGIGGGWEHITVRGNATVPAKLALQKASDEQPGHSSGPDGGEDAGKRPPFKSTLVIAEDGDFDGNAVTC